LPFPILYIKDAAVVRVLLTGAILGGQRLTPRPYRYQDL
jgi:hypothetical protein